MSDGIAEPVPSTTGVSVPPAPVDDLASLERTRASALIALILCSIVAGFLVVVLLDGDPDGQVFVVLTGPPTTLFLVNAVIAVVRPTRGASGRLFAFWLLTLIVDLWLLVDLTGLPDASRRSGALTAFIVTAVVCVVGMALCLRRSAAPSATDQAAAAGPSPR